MFVNPPSYKKAATQVHAALRSLVKEKVEDNMMTLNM